MLTPANVVRLAWYVKWLAVAQLVCAVVHFSMEVFILASHEYPFTSSPGVLAGVGLGHALCIALMAVIQLYYAYSFNIENGKNGTEVFVRSPTGRLFGLTLMGGITIFISLLFSVANYSTNPANWKSWNIKENMSYTALGGVRCLVLELEIMVAVAIACLTWHLTDTPKVLLTGKTGDGETIYGGQTIPCTNLKKVSPAVERPILKVKKEQHAVRVLPDLPTAPHREMLYEDLESMKNAGGDA